MSALALGSLMPDFALEEPATGRKVRSEDLRPHTPVVIAFVSNHCPHSLAWEERLLQVGRDFQARVSMLMISSNDPERSPVCAPEAIATRARERDYPIPYLFDTDQSVALAFDAERTPDVFVFDGVRRLSYHGTVDDNQDDPEQVKASYVRDALAALLDGTPVPIGETALKGCGLKWKPGSVGSIRYAGKLMAAQDSSWTDQDLASAFGYQDEAHFSNRFKELTGQTPKQFRETLT
jgi:peroxiredoxin